MGPKTLNQAGVVVAKPVVPSSGFRVGSMINNTPPFKGLNIRIPIIIPIKGGGFMNQRSGFSLENGCCKEFYED